MKKIFHFEFSDESEAGKITLDYGAEDPEELKFGSEQGLYLAANRAGFLSLSKLFAKLALSEYPPGYHVHLGEDFASAGDGESLRILLLEDVCSDPSR